MQQVFLVFFPQTKKSDPRATDYTFQTPIRRHFAYFFEGKMLTFLKKMLPKYGGAPFCQGLSTQGVCCVPQRGQNKDKNPIKCIRSRIIGPGAQTDLATKSADRQRQFSIWFKLFLMHITINETERPHSHRKMRSLFFLHCSNIYEEILFRNRRDRIKISLDWDPIQKRWVFSRVDPSEPFWHCCKITSHQCQ